MPFTAFILDDEKSACQVLNSMIDEYCPQIEVILVTQDPNLALKEIEEKRPQVLFIDINMPKMSGFEFIDKMPDSSIKIIFTTAYDEFAIKAFRYAAFDYLLKPIHVEHLEQCVGRLEKEFNPSDNAKGRELLLNFAQNGETVTNSTLAVNHNGDMKFLNKKDLFYLEASGNYTVIHSESSRYTTSKTLKEHENVLDENQFLRIHKSFIINIEKVVQFSHKNGGNLELVNGAFIPVARRKKHLLKRFV